MLTREAARGLAACKLTDTDFAIAEDPSKANVGLQAEQMQTSSLGNVDAPSMNKCPEFIVPLNKDNSLVKAVL